MELREPELFETKIFAKHFCSSAFRTELARVDLGESVAIGTATDPYQPAERRYRVTRRILEVLAEERGRRLSLTTKSDLVARDAELLERIARRNVLHINVTVTTMDTELARLIEPRAPRPDLRMNAVEKLVGRGISAGVFASPVLPLLTDSTENLRTLGHSASRAGARYFHAHAVFLKPCARQVFFPFLEQRFPQLVERYRRQFESNAFLKGLYPGALSERVEAVRKEFRLARSPVSYVPEDGVAQMTLFG